jgi:hypothetical protein
MLSKNSSESKSTPESQGDSAYLARQETMLFYRSKGTSYNVWFMGQPTLYFRTKLTLQGS